MTQLYFFEQKIHSDRIPFCHHLQSCLPDSESSLNIQSAFSSKFPIPYYVECNFNWLLHNISLKDVYVASSVHICDELAKFHNLSGREFTKTTGSAVDLVELFPT